MKITLIIIALVATVASAPLDLSSIMQEIPEDVRVEFLKYHVIVGQALSENHIFLPEVVELPKSFSVDLYEETKEKSVVLDDITSKQMRVKICFDDGTCLDMGDIGVHPHVTKDSPKK